MRQSNPRTIFYYRYYRYVRMMLRRYPEMRKRPWAQGRRFGWIWSSSANRRGQVR